MQQNRASNKVIGNKRNRIAIKGGCRKTVFGRCGREYSIPSLLIKTIHEFHFFMRCCAILNKLLLTKTLGLLSLRGKRQIVIICGRYGRYLPQMTPLDPPVSLNAPALVPSRLFRFFLTEQSPCSSLVQVKVHLRMPRDFPPSSIRHTPHRSVSPYIHIAALTPRRFPSLPARWTTVAGFQTASGPAPHAGPFCTPSPAPHSSTPLRGRSGGGTVCTGSDAFLRSCRGRPSGRSRHAAESSQAPLRAASPTRDGPAAAAGTAAGVPGRGVRGRPSGAVSESVPVHSDDGAGAARRRGGAVSRWGGAGHVGRAAAASGS